MLRQLSKLKGGNLLKFLSRPKYTDVVTGNSACSYVAYALSESSYIYPITPSSSMAEDIDAMAAEGVQNIFGQDVRVTEMQSEGGAAGAVHGSLAVGSLTSTFTASQGLLLMLPNMYKIAGELMPGVFHVAARAVSGQALSIFGDHSDVMACRASGYAFLCSSSVQEVHDLAIVAHLSAFKSSLPFCHFFDGFRTSHELQKIELLEYDEIASLVNIEDIERYRERCLTPENPQMRGSSQTPDIFFQMNELPNRRYEALPGVVVEMMEKVGKLTGRDYLPFDYVGHPEAEDIIILMGSAAETVEETVDYLVDQGRKVGCVKVRLFRPFSVEYFLQAVPQTVERVAVLDRTKEPGSFGEPLYLEVCSALHQSRPDVKVIGGRYGLGSKEFTPSMVDSVFDNLAAETPKTGFTVGIVDDLTNKSLRLKESISTSPEGTKRCVFWGIGGDGTVGANQSAIEIIGNNTDMYAQGYFHFDAKKSGGVTVSHLRFGDSRIKSTYMVPHADYTACSVPAYIGRYDILERARDGSIFVMNSPWKTAKELDEVLPDFVKKEIAAKDLQVYTIDANAISQECELGDKTSMVMQTVFFLLSKVLPLDEALGLLKEDIKKTFFKKGNKIVNNNLRCVDEAIDKLNVIKYDKEAWGSLETDCYSVDKAVEKQSDIDFVNEILTPCSILKGDCIPVSKLQQIEGGLFPTSMSQHEKRGVAFAVAQWNLEAKKACIQCNKCAMVCPHGAIRPFMASDKEMLNAPESFKTVKTNYKDLDGLNFRIQCSVLDCMGCKNCVNACPQDCIDLVPLSEVRDEHNNWEFALTLKGNKDARRHLDKYTVKGSQYHQPYLEFSGACAGCGETPYIKLLTQLFGDRMVIANATGCSSIWGGSAPTSPYCVNDHGHGPTWANSLFEDNAEFGLGMAVSSSHQRDHLRDLVEVAMDKLESWELRTVLHEWLDNYDDKEKSIEWGYVIKQLLSNTDDDVFKKVPEMAEIAKKSSLLGKLSFWCFGGDGWAYDIGYGGLIHTLASGQDINVFVMDTEVYSNTGGQASKATNIGATAKFASSGKKTGKMDLGKMAMALGNVYVASVAMGANEKQLFKAIKEAESWKGPSLIIGYAPCIAHGIQGSMQETQYEEELAVKSGYWLLYRYHPENGFKLDSKKIKIEKLDELLQREVRFKSLEKLFPDEALRLHTELKENVVDRFDYYKALMEFEEKQQ